MDVVMLHNSDSLHLMEEGTGAEVYGGRQAWFAKESQRVRGCGPVAAANILCYRAGGMTQRQFLVLMAEMYKALSPTWIGGVFTCRRFVRGVMKWAKGRGLPLTARVFSSRAHGPGEALAMIRQALEQDRPVAALNLKLRYAFGWHWVTITGLETGPDGKTQLIASSWGRLVLLDWDEYWRACRKALLPGGFVWFE